MGEDVHVAAAEALAARPAPRRNRVLALWCGGEALARGITGADVGWAGRGLLKSGIATIRCRFFFLERDPALQFPAEAEADRLAEAALVRAWLGGQEAGEEGGKRPVGQEEAL